ncbi:hypothetical protein N7495_000610 [Penicillium taxi]|uniref:uncharacterized protein n=1 Tax=Penicillium taxi TaxID=168475 RepID=UPI002545BD65|nr:uncharacterized protein N7495_000610 [Penicillium taxi]KAJ5907928.1 hypothetical protein N7495_000610 [Penicillium taxi]
MSKLLATLAGPGYLILNTVRVLNIIAFLDIIAACVVMLIKTHILNGYFFFQAVTHAVIAIISIFLIISELPIFRGYFNRNWPLFGEDAGFIALAGVMMILGVATLGNLNLAAMSQKDISLAFWRVVLSAGILGMVMSVGNVLATLVFTDRKSGVSARQVRAYGAAAPSEVMSRASSHRSFQLGVKRDDSLPTYSPQPALKRATKRFTNRFPLKISTPFSNNNNNNNNNNLNVPGNRASSRYSRGPNEAKIPDEEMAEVKMPDLAHHPAMYSGYLWPELVLTSPGERINSVKSLLVFFAPIIIPRLINAYRSFRVVKATRPPPCHLPTAASRSLNLLFGSIVFFLILSLPFNPHAPEPNVFALTRSRINTPTDVVFQRLARLRPDSILTDTDTLLREKLTSLGARKAYLTFGPDTVTSCQYCSFDNVNTFFLYYLPFHILLPHLLHLLILGVATSTPFGGRESARWRNKFTIAGLVLAAFDLWTVATYDALQSESPAVRAGQLPPTGLYNYITLLRPLAITVSDAVFSLIIYLSATNRFFYKQTSPVDQLDQALSAALTNVNDTNSKLHALNVTRNAVVRDKALKARDDLYWQTMVNVESPRHAGEGAPGHKVEVMNNIWEEEQVARALSRAMAGQGGVDLAQLGIDADNYVSSATADLI